MKTGNKHTKKALKQYLFNFLNKIDFKVIEKFFYCLNTVKKTSLFMQGKLLRPAVNRVF